MERISNLTFRGNKVRIDLEDGRHFIVKRIALDDYPLEIGSEAEEDSFMQFIRIHQYPDALNSAVAMLARRACSRKEIADKMRQQGFCEDVADLVLYKLEKEGLLNDRDFSGQWARYRAGGHYGAGRIYRELRMKGVDEETAKEAIGFIDREEQYQAALDLAAKTMKKAGSGEDSRKTRQRIIRTLVSRGFDWDTARDVCNQIMDEE